MSGEYFAKGQENIDQLNNAYRQTYEKIRANPEYNDSWENTLQLEGIRRFLNLLGVDTIDYAPDMICDGDPNDCCCNQHLDCDD